MTRRSGTKLVLIGDGPSRRRLQRLPGSERFFWLPFERDRARLADLLALGHVEAVRSNLFDQLTPTQVRQLRVIAEKVLAHLGGESGLPPAQ